MMRVTGTGPRLPRIVSVLMGAGWCVAAWQAFVIPESAIQMAVGAREVPAGVVLFLGVIIVLYGVSAWRGRQPDQRGEDGQGPESGAVARMLWLLGGGAAFMLLVQPLGFVVPAALCAAGVARAFDAPWSLRMVGVCGLIAGVFWAAFAAGLGVGLGPAFRGLG